MNCEKLFKVVCFVFSIRHSNAAPERIFSLMWNSWRAERNRLSMATVEAELMAKTNYSFICLECRRILDTEEGKKLLKRFKSEQKYQYGRMQCFISF